MKRIKFKDFISLKNNMRKIINMLWKYDKKTVIIYYLIISYRIIFPIALSFFWKYIIDYIAYGSASTSIYYALVLFAIYLGMIFINKYYYHIYYNQYLSYIMRSILQNKVAYAFTETISNLDMSQLENSEMHDMISKNDAKMIWMIPIMTESFANFIVGFFTFVLVLIILIGYGIWIPILLIIISLPKLYYQLSRNNVTYSMWDINVPNVKALWYVKRLLVTKNSIRELKMYNSIGNMLRKLDDLQEEIFKKYRDPIEKYKNKTFFTTILGYIAIFIILAYFLNSLLAGLITLGTFIFIKDNAIRFMEETEMFYSSFSELYDSNIYAKEYFSFLDIKPTIKEAKKPKVIDLNDGIEIEFKNVSFKYPGKDIYAVEDISFKIKNGENIAIVGENGAGKSTIIKLLFRTYDVTKGEILINNINIKDISFASLNHAMSILFQDYVSYNFTVEEDIYISDMKNINKEKIEEAAKLSFIDKKINKLPHKYKQQLGKEYKDGEEISGGEWQKLAIARTLYKNSPVLVLDEATSSIDAETEFKIFENILNHYKERTLIIITHRFSSIKNADKILVLEKGNKIEEGTHKELMSKNTKYKKMYNIQAKQYK